MGEGTRCDSLRFLPLYQYGEVHVFGVRKTEIDFKFVPSTPTSVEYYTGSVTVEVDVEGNLCTLDSETVGILRQRRGNDIFISLIAGVPMANEAMGCAQFGYPSWAKFNLPFTLYFAEPGHEESLGILSLPNRMTGAVEKHDFRIKFDGKSVKLDVVVTQ